MVDWSSPAVLQQSIQALQGILIGQLAILSYELANTLWFEYELITGKTKMRWPLVLVLMARWFMVPATILGVISLYPGAYSDSACRSIFGAEFAFLILAHMPATAIFTLRTFVLYDKMRFGRFVQGFLIVGWLGALATYIDIAITALQVEYEPNLHQCVVVGAKEYIWDIFLYFLIFDSILVVLQCVRLAPHCKGTAIISNGRQDSYTNMLLRQGIFYYLASVFAAAWAWGWYLSPTNSVLRNFGTNLDALVVTIAASKASLTLIKSGQLSTSNSNSPSSSRRDILTAEFATSPNSTISLPMTSSSNRGPRPGEVGYVEETETHISRKCSGTSSSAQSPYITWLPPSTPPTAAQADAQLPAIPRYTHSRQDSDWQSPTKQGGMM